ncbi:MAG: lipoprotein insertase outer membrane protein LolB [Gammaproteobacteria bacterium]|jgi:outer membrane lipoprotein LolB
MRFAWLLLALMLGGCASLPPDRAVQHADWTMRVAHLQSAADWRLDGRVAVRVDGKGWQASLRWQQRPAGYEIDIYGPLGRILARLRGNPRTVVLQTARGERYQAADPERLMNQALGWQLPVQGMRYWLLGVPVPGEATEGLALDADGRAQTFRQAGWTVTYDNYLGGPADRSLPQRVTLVRPGVRVRLVVDSWDLGHAG